MPLLINLRHLEHKNVDLAGEMTAEELDLVLQDELIHVPGPLRYDLQAQRLEGNVLVQGHLHLTLQCECARCLKPFKRELDIPHWALHLPLSGEEPVQVVSDCVDLTPYLREDILLAFPQHPLCESECGGLKKSSAETKGSSGADDDISSAWAELDKLKL